MGRYVAEMVPKGKLGPDDSDVSDPIQILDSTDEFHFPIKYQDFMCFGKILGIRLRLQ